MVGTVVEGAISSEAETRVLSETDLTRLALILIQLGVRLLQCPTALKVIALIR
jgi:hypothetical protein